MNTHANGKGTSTAEMEDEWETHEASHYNHPYANPELEDEGELFFGKRLGRFIQQAARVAAPLAKQLAPIAARTLVGAIPGAGVVAGPLAGRLVSSLLRDGELEAEQMEAEFFGTHEAEAEVANTEAAHEATLTEVLAAEASHSESESEAVALMGTALPIAIRSVGGKQSAASSSTWRSLRPIMPTLLRATTRLVRLLHRRGPTGRQLLRLMPTILRRTTLSLRLAQRAGRPITPTLAQRVMAGQAARVLGNSQIVTRSMIRNAVLRERAIAQSSFRSHPRMA